MHGGVGSADERRATRLHYTFDAGLLAHGSSEPQIICVDQIAFTFIASVKTKLTFKGNHKSEAAGAWCCAHVV